VNSAKFSNIDRVCKQPRPITAPGYPLGYNPQTEIPGGATANNPIIGVLDSGFP